ncbi:MAG: tRNA pseudouridine(55) synthase TruB [Crocinitomicaceae bacterium]
MDFEHGEILLVDKPLHWTSFDVVNKLRWIIKSKLKENPLFLGENQYDIKKRIKNYKVGHAGTLDPLATGLLVICIGKKTKEIDSFIGEEKEYTGTFLLGKTTPSFDLETEYNSENSTEGITKKQMQEAAQELTGKIRQAPPSFSAKWVGGKRAYDLARQGKEVEMKKNLVQISTFEIYTSNFPEIMFRIVCSKGTYIRSIAHDYGQILGCGATLIELRRTRSGSFKIEDAKTIVEMEEIIRNA